MSAVKLPVTSLRVKNFKAVQDSGVIKPGGLTVFVGDNGSGKSSVLEALRFVSTLAHDTLDNALAPFKGFENVRWQGGRKRGRAAPDAPFGEYRPIEITLRGHTGASNAKVSAVTRISGQSRNRVLFEHEELRVGGDAHRRAPDDRKRRANRSILHKTAWFDDWQFFALEPSRMGQPTRRTRTEVGARLLADGSNLAEYLLALRHVPGEGIEAWNGLVDMMQVILPFATDLLPDLREEFESLVGLQLWEKTANAEVKFTVPGWMLSTGTLRLLALLALLRHPSPPKLLCVEEIENGLDPRTIDLVVGELLRVAEKGRTQVMVTTHSPYLLDVVPLESLVLVSRGEKGPRFDRPAEHEEVRAWAKKFAPGRLYTMGTLHGRVKA